ncbi:MAG: GntR family transcriptional regulator [Roseicyclus sp.]|nr:GntR family transcriptional regulator [Roseicyclus sp.]
MTIDNLSAEKHGMEMRQDIRDSLARRRQRPLVQEVRDELERMILHGEIPGGERLNEAALAEELGVSRGPVREAARSLEREGLVRTVANDGVYVRRLSVDEVLELYDLRAMIAGYLCGRLAARGDAETAARLAEDVAQMDAAIAAGDEPRYFALNLGFHDRIATAAGAERARTLYTALGKEVRLMRRRVLSGAASLRTSNAEHAQIAAAIAAGDAARAQALGAAHHENAKERLLETL